MADTDAFEALHLDDLERIESFQDVTWLPIRRQLGIEAFGVNAFEGDAGKLVVEEHDELGTGGSGTQEELYFVASGRAKFTVAGEEIPAPQGTFVFLRDPAAKRKAVAEEDGTIVLALGATRGAVFEPSAWEWLAPSIGRHKAGDYPGARDVVRAGLERLPDHPSLLYNLACFEVICGETDAALEHLARGLDLDPRMRDWAVKDEDFDAVRDDPRFTSLVTGKPGAVRKGT
jgi:hypothetical protein